MPQLPNKRKFSGMFRLKTKTGELALGDDSEALKPVTEIPGNQGEMVGPKGNDLSHSPGIQSPSENGNGT